MATKQKQKDVTKYTGIDGSENSVIRTRADAVQAVGNSKRKVQRAIVAVVSHAAMHGRAFGAIELYDALEDSGTRRDAILEAMSQCGISFEKGSEGSYTVTGVNTNTAKANLNKLKAKGWWTYTQEKEWKPMDAFDAIDRALNTAGAHHKKVHKELESATASGDKDKLAKAQKHAEALKECAQTHHLQALRIITAAIKAGDVTAEDLQLLIDSKNVAA